MLPIFSSSERKQTGYHFIHMFYLTSVNERQTLGNYYRIYMTNL